MIVIALEQYTVSGGKRPIVFLHGCDKFISISAIFGMQHHRSNAKLLTLILYSSPHQCKYFAVQKQMLTTLLYNDIKNGKVQGNSRGFMFH